MSPTSADINMSPTGAAHEVPDHSLSAFLAYKMGKRVFHF